MLCVVQTIKDRINCGIYHSLDFLRGVGGVANKYIKYFVAIMTTRLQPYGHVHGVGPKVKRCINK